MNERKEFAERICGRVAKVAWEQIVGTTGANIVASWCIRGVGAGVVINESGYYLPCLVLAVSGLIHKGRVIVALNEGLDEYEVALWNKSGQRVGRWHTGLMFDELGAKIDELVERPKGMTDEDYMLLSMLDSDIQELTGE